MSQLAKALKNLETRGTAFAPTAQPPLAPAAAPLPSVAEPAPIVAGAASFAPVKPRPAARIRPRRVIQSPSDPPPPQPILKSLAAPRVEAVLADPNAPSPPPELVAVRENYELSP